MIVASCLAAGATAGAAALIRSGLVGDTDKPEPTTAFAACVAIAAFLAWVTWRSSRILRRQPAIVVERARVHLPNASAGWRAIAVPLSEIAFERSAVHRGGLELGTRSFTLFIDASDFGDTTTAETVFLLLEHLLATTEE
jgi:hypothetical protein